MVSARVVGQVGALAVAVGAGFFIASACDGAVASASPGDTGHSGVGSSAPAHSAPSTAHRSAAAATSRKAPAASAISAVPASVSTTLVSAKATPSAPHLPTPAEVQAAVQGAVQTVRRDLVALEHNIEYALHIKPAPQKIYGNLANAKYWALQSAENCVLMASASIVGQLTGTMPTEKAIADIATSTQSVVDPSRKMYLGLQTDDRVAIGDAEELLKTSYNIDAVTTDTYKKTQGLTAFRALEKDLKAGKAVMVGVNAGVIWNAEGATPTPGALAESADHEISVIAINATTKTVYINDSGTDKGAGMAVPLAVFMRAWRADSFELTAAVLAEAASSSIAA